MKEDALGLVDGGEAVADEVRARRFTLVDRQGSCRGSLGLSADGSPALFLYDQRAQPRVELVLEAGGAANLKLQDGEGEVTAWLSVGANGSPSLYLRGAAHQQRLTHGHAELCVDARGCPMLSLHDRNGKPRVLLSLGEQDGTPSLSFSEASGELRVLLSGDPDRGSLLLYPHDGRSRSGVAVPLGAPAEPLEALPLAAGVPTPPPTFVPVAMPPLGIDPADGTDAAAPDGGDGSASEGFARVAESAHDVAESLATTVGEMTGGEEDVDGAIPVPGSATPDLVAALANAAPPVNGAAADTPSADPPPADDAPATPVGDGADAASAASAPPPLRPRRRIRRRLFAVAALVAVGVGLGLGVALVGPLPLSNPILALRPAPEAPPAPRPTPAAPAPAPVETRIVEAEEVILRGRDGETHARLGVMPDGSPFLQLTGAGGRGTAELSVLPSQGAVLRLSDGTGMLALSARGDGTTEVTLHGRGEEARAALFLQEDGTPVLSMTDEAGRVRAGLSLAQDGSPSLSLYDESTLRALLGSSTATSSLMLLGKDGKIVYQAPR
jgi:hypothetical protein